MSIEYTIKTTRPSLEHMFWFELTIDTFNLIHPQNTELLHTVADVTYDDAVAWDYIIERRADLRPDLIFLLKDFHTVEDILNFGFNNYSPFNPFLLGHTTHIKFSNIEDFMNLVKQAPKDSIKEAIAQSENSVEDSLLDFNGNSLVDVLKEYSLINS